MSRAKGKLWYGWRDAGCRDGIKVVLMIPVYLTSDSVNGRSVDRMRYKRIKKGL